MHTMLYYLVLAMYPRMMFALDENLEPLQVDIRVGQAVDTVGMPGRPKSITGFQTHKSPVLLNYGDRAELGTEEYIPVTPIIENFVILRKNPDYKPPEEIKARKY
jgi:26S proteasome regulatory subunit N1